MFSLGQHSQFQQHVKNSINQEETAINLVKRACCLMWPRWNLKGAALLLGLTPRTVGCYQYVRTMPVKHQLTLVAALKKHAQHAEYLARRLELTAKNTPKKNRGIVAQQAAGKAKPGAKSSITEASI